MPTRVFTGTNSSDPETGETKSIAQDVMEQVEAITMTTRTGAAVTNPNRQGNVRAICKASGNEYLVSFDFGT